jgi:hypothetical protein
MTVRSGKCLCGQVQICVRSEPLRIGICHCTLCRRERGSAFTFYAVWPWLRPVEGAAQYETEAECRRPGSHAAGLSRLRM